MGKTIIFLDIDGVLNSYDSTSRIGRIRGVDDEKIDCIKEIVDFLDAEIVLSSSWKAYWDKSLATDGVNNWRGNSPKRDGRYVNIKLGRRGVKISDKTPDITWRFRAKEIIRYLENNDADRILILDDEEFAWSTYGLKQYWINTVRMDGPYFNEGLTPEIVNEIKLLADKGALDFSKDRGEVAKFFK